MSDNLPIPNSIYIAGTDEIDGKHYQRIKLIHGADGINDGDVSNTNPMPVEDVGLTLLRRIFLLLKPLGQITGGGSNRLSVDVNNVVGGTIGTVSTVTTVTTVSTVSSVTNQANMGGVAAFEMMKALSRTGYNQGIRSRL
jgi:hypothetical protein